MWRHSTRPFLWELCVQRRKIKKEPLFPRRALPLGNGSIWRLFFQCKRCIWKQCGLGGAHLPPEGGSLSHLWRRCLGNPRSAQRCVYRDGQIDFQHPSYRYVQAAPFRNGKQVETLDFSGFTGRVTFAKNMFHASATSKPGLKQVILGEGCQVTKIRKRHLPTVRSWRPLTFPR